MKKILNFLVLGSAFAVIVAGCKGKGPANDPKAVVAAFFEKMAKKTLMVRLNWPLKTVKLLLI